MDYVSRDLQGVGGIGGSSRLKARASVRLFVCSQC